MEPHDEDFVPSLPPPSRFPRGQRVIAVGGGRGGVGKSTLTLNLGVYFAQLGKSVLVCDADPLGSNLHAMLGLQEAPLVPFDLDSDRRPKKVATPVPGLSLLPMGFDLLSMSRITPSRRLEWQRWTQAEEADYVLFHLGASTSLACLDLFSSADVGICVAAPEPIAIETTYGFVRALFARALRRRISREKLKLKLVERALGQLLPMASPLEIIEAIHRYDQQLGNMAAIELRRLRPNLVVGQTRLRSDLELGPSMSSIALRFLGTRVDYLGHVEHDDAAWLSVRKQNPLLIESPTSKSARNIERIARRVLAMLMSQEARGAADNSTPAGDFKKAAPMNLYEVLGIGRTAADDEIRRAYKRQREIFRDGSFPAVSVVREDLLRQEQLRIEEAYDTLLDPNKRRAYDLSTFPQEAQLAEPVRGPDEERKRELRLLEQELMREVHAETEFSGSLLRQIREVQGVSLAEIAQKTKISTTHLLAIEEERASDLPAMVYVQGFVQEYAKFLRLDPSHVVRTYTRRLRELSGRR